MEQVVVITGAAGGIGMALAHAFAERGAALLLGDLDAEVGAALAAALRDEGRTATFVPCDVRSSDEFDRILAVKLRGASPAPRPTPRPSTAWSA